METLEFWKERALRAEAAQKMNAETAYALAQERGSLQDEIARLNAELDVLSAQYQRTALDPATGDPR
jgi:hypothetical protein